MRISQFYTIWRATGRMPLFFQSPFMRANAGLISNITRALSEAFDVRKRSDLRVDNNRTRYSNRAPSRSRLPAGTTRPSTNRRYM